MGWIRRVAVIKERSNDNQQLKAKSGSRGGNGMTLKYFTFVTMERKRRVPQLSTTTNIKKRKKKREIERA